MKASRLVIYPYKMGSQSAKRLAEKLTTKLGSKVRRVKANGKYRPKLRSLVVNYGSQSQPHWLGGVPNGRILNLVSACQRSSNKLAAFTKWKADGVATVEWTTDRAVANEWCKKHIVFSRTLLNAHSGRGIIVNPIGTEQVAAAPLYTKYMKKKREFRVHVFEGCVIDVVEKRRRSGIVMDNNSGLIRNFTNGWVFCRDGIVRPADLDNLAIKACSSLGLSFGAVDVVFNEHYNKCYVLEVNTAPGLEGSTIESYANAIVKWSKERE